MKEMGMTIEAICLSYGSLYYWEMNVEKTLAESIRLMMERYDSTGDGRYAQNALCHLHAYLRMGFAYILYETLFDRVCQAAGEDSYALNRMSYQQYLKKVRLTPPKVRSMIRKWMPSANNPMKIGEVVADIIDKVRRQEMGIHRYRYRHGKTEDLYELVITEEQTFFRDVNENHFYYLEVPEQNEKDELSHEDRNG